MRLERKEKSGKKNGSQAIPSSSRRISFSFALIWSSRPPREHQSSQHCTGNQSKCEKKTGRAPGGCEKNDKKAEPSHRSGGQQKQMKARLCFPFSNSSDFSIPKPRPAHAPERELPPRQEEKEEEEAAAAAADGAFIADEQGNGTIVAVVTVVVDLFNSSTSSSVCAAARARRRRMHRGRTRKERERVLFLEKLLTIKRKERSFFFVV